MVCDRKTLIHFNIEKSLRFVFYYCQVQLSEPPETAAEWGVIFLEKIGQFFSIKCHMSIILCCKNEGLARSLGRTRSLQLCSPKSWSTRSLFGLLQQNLSPKFLSQRSRSTRAHLGLRRLQTVHSWSHWYNWHSPDLLAKSRGTRESVCPKSSLSHLMKPRPISALILRLC